MKSNIEHAITKLEARIDRVKYYHEKVGLEFLEELLVDLKQVDDGLQAEIQQAYDDGAQDCEDNHVCE